MKKRIIILLTFILSLSLFGCDKNDTFLHTQTKEEINTNDKVEIEKEPEKESETENTIVKLSKLSDIKNISLEETNKEQYIRMKLSTGSGYTGIAGVYEMDFFDTNNNYYTIKTTEDIAELIQSIEYFDVDVILFKEEKNEEIYYKLINFRFIEPNGTIIESLEKEDLKNKAIELDLVKNDGNHEEILIIYNIENNLIRTINENNIIRTIRYEEDIDIHTLEIGKTYKFKYNSTYDKDWEDFQYKLLETPLKTDDIKIDLDKYIKKETNIPIWEMTKSLEETNTEDTERLTLDSYNTTLVYGGEWGLWDFDIFFDTHSSLCELAKLTDGYYKIDLVVKDDKIINARFIDTNGKTIESIQYDDVIKKLEEDKFVYIKEKTGIFTITDYSFDVITAIDENNNILEFTYNEAFPEYKIYKNETYTFNYQEIEKLNLDKNKYKTTYILKEMTIK